MQGDILGPLSLSSYSPRCPWEQISSLHDIVFHFYADKCTISTVAEATSLSSPVILALYCQTGEFINVLPEGNVPPYGRSGDVIYL